VVLDAEEVLREFQFRHQFQRCVLRRDDYGYDYDDARVHAHEHGRDHAHDRGRDRDRDDGHEHGYGDDVRVLPARPYIDRNRNCRRGIRDNYSHSRMYIRRHLFRSNIHRKSRQSGSKRNIHGGYALHSARLLTPKS